MQPAIKIVNDGLLNDKVTIAFSRQPGASDVQIAIDTSVEDTNEKGQRVQSRKAGLEFLKCVKQLIENVSAR
jgi:hypothetical protein